MTENEEEAIAPEATPPRRNEERARTPFDYPLVFPAMLFALGLWFGYDGWFNAETKSIMFNRVMFCVFAVAFVWTLIVDLRTMRRSKDAQKVVEAKE